jgi:hypothetical protein
MPFTISVGLPLLICIEFYVGVGDLKIEELEVLLPIAQPCKQSCTRTLHPSTC